MKKYKLQYFDEKAGVWATYFRYLTLENALGDCPALAANKLTRVRIVVEVEVVIYNYNED